jgi:hypothetical protein
VVIIAGGITTALIGVAALAMGQPYGVYYR